MDFLWADGFRGFLGNSPETIHTKFPFVEPFCMGILSKIPGFFTICKEINIKQEVQVTHFGCVLDKIN